MVTPQHLFRTVGANDSGEHDSYSISLGNDLELHVAGYSHVGSIRKHNEDNYLLQDGLLVVCDGMGGHNAGEAASEIACTVFGENHSEPDTNLQKDLITLAEEANTVIYREANRDSQKTSMGTTLVVARFDDAKINFTNVGDSRLYRYSLDDYTLDQLTVDHSLVQNMFDKGRITGDDMKTHKLRNVLTLSLGYEQTLDTEKIKEYTIDCSAGDVYLLCSDGLLVLDDAVIKKVMDETYAAYPENDLAVAHALVAAANNAGGPDNITVVLARVASLSLETVIKNGLAAVVSGDSDTVVEITRKYSEHLRALGSSKADFLLGVASEANNMPRQAVSLYESVLKTTPVVEREFSSGSYYRQTIERLAGLYGSIYGTQLVHFQKHFDKLCELRSLDSIEATPLQETIDAVLVQRIAGIGKELIENYSPTTKTSYAACELEKLARDVRIQDIPRVRDAFVSIYTALTERAITAGSISDAVHFIDCVQAVDSSVSVFKNFIQEGIPHLNYQQARARFALGEAPEHVLDILQHFSVEEYNGGAAAVLFLEAQCLEKQGKQKEALTTLEQAVRADCSDPKYGVERQDVFVACAKAYEQTGKLRQARAVYRQALVLPEHSTSTVSSAEIHYQIAKTYQHEGRYADARAHYRMGISHNPTNVEAHLRVAESYEMDSRFSEARAYYRKVLAFSPDQKEARDGLTRCRK